MSENNPNQVEVECKVMNVQVLREAAPAGETGKFHRQNVSLMQTSEPKKGVPRMTFEIYIEDEEKAATYEIGDQCLISLVEISSK